MLTIHYNGNEIPTGRDFSVRFSWVNPACYFDSIPGAAGLGIDIPVNDHSRAIFGSPHRFEKYGNGSDRKFKDVEIRFNGVLLMSGTLNITNATSQTYSGWLQSELGALGDQQREKFLPDMPWKSNVPFVNDTLTDDSTHEYGLVTFKNSHFWEGKGKEATETDENGREVTMSSLGIDFRKNFGSVVNFYDGQGVKTTGRAVVVSPFLYLRYVIREIFKMNNWFIERNDMVPTFQYLTLFKNLMVFNNYNLMNNEFTTEYRTFPIFNYDINEDIDTLVYEITTMSWVTGKLDYKYMVPRMALKDFLLGLQNLLNIVFFFRPYNRVDIIDRDAIITGEAFDIDNYFTGEWLIGERKNLTLKFISEYDSHDSVFADGFHDLSDRRSDFGEPVEDMEELNALTGMRLGELRLVKSLFRVYEYKWSVATDVSNTYHETQTDILGWELASVGEQPYFYGTGDEIEEIKTCACTWYRSPREDLQVLYEVKQQGNIKSMVSLWNDFGLRIVNVNDILHPGGLYFDCETGLFNRRWKKWAGFWSTRLPVEAEFDFPLNVLHYVANHITGKFKTNHGEFIIEEMETEFSVNRIGTTRIRGFKI